jgi:purine-binding chemotaxis protein CheW
MPAIVRDYYRILEVDTWVDQAAIDTAFRRLALLYHPDLNHSPDAHLRMLMINEAYTVLKSPAKRAKYDHERAIHTPPRPGPVYSRPPSRPQYHRPPPPPPPPSAAPPPSVEEQLLLFYLEHSSFGFTLQDMEGVVMLQPISPRPHLAHFAEGSIYTRQAEIPVVDLRRHMGMAVRPVTKTSRIILARSEGLRVGLIVDSVENFITLPAGSIDVPPLFTKDRNTGFIKGIAKLDSRLVILLDPGGLFTSEEKAALMRL